MSVGVVLGLIILCALVILTIYNIKITNIKQWLKYAVVEAEKFLGGKTGQLKLRYVYDLAVKQFPWIVTFITFEVFSGWVDEALEWMKDQIQQNKAIDNYINK